MPLKNIKINNCQSKLVVNKQILKICRFESNMQDLGLKGNICNINIPYHSAYHCIIRENSLCLLECCQGSERKARRHKQYWHKTLVAPSMTVLLERKRHLIRRDIKYYTNRRIKCLPQVHY